MKKLLIHIIISISFLIIFSITNYSYAFSKKNNSYSDTVRIKNDLYKITKTFDSRYYKNVKTLDSVAEYIFNELKKTCDTVYFQPFLVDGKIYKNVIGVLGIKNTERIVVGAHYDVAYIQEGADDNASGLVGLLELSRLLSKEKLTNRIDFVAFTLEEPPYFDSENMGSFIHAKYLSDNNIKIKGMICLEMIGYYSDKPHSQQYPLGFLKLFYGTKADFITVVQKFGNGKFGRKVKRLMKRQKLIKTKSFKAPSFVSGIDLSDHLNYWKFNFKAVMITNTSFYRNNNYHEATDKMETLDIKRMGLVIDEIFLTVKELY